MYAELSYFDGYHFQHIADWQEQRRIDRLHRQAVAAIDNTRRRSLRGGLLAGFVPERTA